MTRTMSVSFRSDGVTPRVHNGSLTAPDKTRMLLDWSMSRTTSSTVLMSALLALFRNTREMAILRTRKRSGPSSAEPSSPAGGGGFLGQTARCAREVK